MAGVGVVSLTDVIGHLKAGGKTELISLHAESQYFAALRCHCGVTVSYV